MSGIAEAWRAMDLRHSRLFRDLPMAPDRRAGVIHSLKVLATGAVGAVGGVIAAMTIGVLLIIGIVLSAGELDRVMDTVGELQAGQAPDSLGANIALIAVLAVVNGIWFLVLVWLASVMRRQKLWPNFTSARRFRWRQLVLGLVLYGVMLGAVLAIEVAAGATEATMPVLTLTKSPAEIAVFVTATVVFLIIAAGAEELLFRGWLLRQTSVVGRNVILLLVVNGLLFSLIHWDFDPNAFIARTVMGIVFGYMALRFGGIEFATGAHAANNILLSLFIEPLSVSIPPPEPFNTGYLLETGLLLIIGIAITEAAARIPALRELGGIEEEDRRPIDEVFE